MTPAGRAVDDLLIEDDPGDELITREAFEHNKIVVRQIDQFFVQMVRLPLS